MLLIFTSSWTYCLRSNLIKELRFFPFALPFLYIYHLLPIIKLFLWYMFFFTKSNITFFTLFLHTFPCFKSFNMKKYLPPLYQVLYNSSSVPDSHILIRHLYRYQYVSSLFENHHLPPSHCFKNHPLLSNLTLILFFFTKLDLSNFIVFHRLFL